MRTPPELDRITDTVLAYRMKGLTLHPLKFDEAVTDILKIKPEPKSPTQRTQPKATGLRKKTSGKQPK